MRLSAIRLTLIAGSFHIIFLSSHAPAAGNDPEHLPRIGYLSTASVPADFADRKAFLEGLRKLGYVDGRNLAVTFRHAGGGVEQLPELAKELVALQPRVIVVAGTRAALTLRDATRSIPIVVISSDPLGSGLVDSFSRPTGNVTGFSLMFQELAGKRMVLFKETFPQVRRLAVLWNAVGSAWFQESRVDATRLGFDILPFEIANPQSLDAAFGAMVYRRAEGLFTFTSAVLSANRKAIVLGAAKHKLPAIYHNHGFVEDGGLMSYAPDLRDAFRRAAFYVDKLLKGAKPASLPVEQPVKFELVINLRAAKEIGRPIPPAVLARADKVIQ